MASVRYAFRETFKPVLKESLQWYPGHMEKSFTKMQAKIKQVDCVIEVHDARIPTSGRNPNFIKRLIGPKPHILVLNKVDLISNKAVGVIDLRLKGEAEHIIFTNSKDQLCRGLKKIVPRSITLVQQSERYNRTEERNLRIMIIGVPNVGKSSLINALRNRIMHKGKATSVGAIAGVTRAVQTDIKINLNPVMYLVDTPGILPPNVNNVENGMKLALCSCLNDNVVGVHQIADYLLYFLNKHQMFSYVDYFGLEEPCDDIVKVLTLIASKNEKVKRVKDLATNCEMIVPDTHAAAYQMIKAFRNTDLGCISLDFPEVTFNTP